MARRSLTYWRDQTLWMGVALIMGLIACAAAVGLGWGLLAVLEGLIRAVG